MNVIIAGSRNLSDKHKDNVLYVLDEIVKNEGLVVDKVIHGCARGPDKWGAEWAESNGYPVQECPADWAQYGQGAGPVRNAEMEKIGDVLIAVWDGHSTGTLDMVKRMQDARKPVFLLRTVFQLSKIVPRDENEVPVDKNGRTPSGLVVA